MYMLAFTRNKLEYQSSGLALKSFPNCIHIRHVHAKHLKMIDIYPV